MSTVIQSSYRSEVSNNGSKNDGRGRQQHKGREDTAAARTHRNTSKIDESETPDNRGSDATDGEKDVGANFVRFGSTVYELYPLRGEMPVIAARLIGPKCLSDWWRATAAVGSVGLSDEQRHFFFHVLRSQLQSHDPTAWVPVPKDTRFYTIDGRTYRRGSGMPADEFELPENGTLFERSNIEDRHNRGWAHDSRTRGADVAFMTRVSLLEHKPSKPGRCARYRVPAYLLESLLRHKTKGEAEDQTRRNLLNGKRTRANPKMKTDTYDQSRNEYPGAVAAGMNGIAERCPYNRNALAAHVGKLYTAKEQARTKALRLCGSEKLRRLETQYGGYEGVKVSVRAECGEEAHTAVCAFETARARYVNDLLCFNTIKLQDSRHEAGDVWTYAPAYKPASTGRISEKGGGLQNMTRVGTTAALEGVEHYNYDIRSCHPSRLLYAEFPRFGIECEWLRQYVEGERSKHNSAQEIGIEVQTWKRCAYSLFTGAKAKRSQTWQDENGNWQSVTHSPYEHLRGADEVEDVEKAFDRLCAHTEPLRAALTAWRDELEGEALTLPAENEHGRIYRNACGMPFHVDQHLTERGDALTGAGRRKLAAHVLQGHEAKFIHTLTDVLAGVDGVEVVGNAHDGFLTTGEVPQSAIDEAKHRTGYDRIVFEEKAIL